MWYTTPCSVYLTGGTRHTMQCVPPWWYTTHRAVCISLVVHDTPCSVYFTGGTRHTVQCDLSLIISKNENNYNEKNKFRYQLQDQSVNQCYTEFKINYQSKKFVLTTGTVLTSLY